MSLTSGSEVFPPAATFPAVLDQAVRHFGTAPWMTFDGQVQAFADLGERVQVIAAGLVAAGVRPGDRVGAYLGNCFEWLQVEYAVTSLGARLVPINTLLQLRELTHVIGQSGTSTLVWADRVLGRDQRHVLTALVPEIAGGAPGDWRSRSFPELRSVVGHGAGPWPTGVLPWAELLAAGTSVPASSVRALERQVSPEDVALVMYTSGTTGAPKGALIRHQAIIDHVAQWTSHLGLGRGDRSIMASPLFWSFGCTINAVVPLLAGSMIVLEDHFEAERFLRDLEVFECTHLQGVPTHYEMALGHPLSREVDLSRIRLIQIGGASSAEGLAKRLLERMPDAQLVSSYGLTEAVGVNTFTELGDPISDVVRTVGHASPGNEIELRDPDTLAPVPAGEVGEIWIRGPNVMVGYHENFDATAEAVVGGWLRTGDLAVADERGYLSIAGRRADAYKRGGVNVYPAEVESVLQEHEGILQAAVIGVPDTLQGSVGAAFVVPAPGHQLAVDDILAFCRSRLAVYKVPALVQVLDDLPRTPTGKVQKFRLLELWQGGGPP